MTTDNEFYYLEGIDIQKRIDKYARKYKNKRILIYGAGKLSDYIFQNYDLSGLNIVAVADKKFEFKDDETFHGHRGIYLPPLKDLEFDVMLFLMKDYIKPFTSLWLNVLYKTKINKQIKIEWILRQNLTYYIKNKLKSFFNKKHIDKNKKYIFTFWDGRKMPGYIKLCIDSWYKYLPDYEIVILNFRNVDEWLGFDYWGSYLNNFTLDSQADAIRIALLAKYGGIWLDADTIITSDKAKKFFEINTEVAQFEKHLAFIKAKKGAKYIKDWLKEIKKRILLQKMYRFFPDILKYVYPIELIAQLQRSSCFCGNFIINWLCLKYKEDKFISIDRHTNYILPEYVYYENEPANNRRKYEMFYYENDFSDYVFEHENGIILLHNSWTPKKYKDMDEEEFLKQEITLAKVLKRYGKGG